MIAPWAALIPPQNVQVAFADGNHMTVRQAADVSTIMLAFQTAASGTVEGTDPPIGNFNFAISGPVDFAGNGTRRDRIAGWGWNISKHAGGSPATGENPLYASCGFTIEDFYNIVGTDLVQFEAYVQAAPAGDDGGQQVRPWMAVVQFPTLAMNTPPELGFYVDVDTSQGFNLTAAYKNVGTLSTRTSDTAGTVTVTAAHNIVTATTMNVRWLAGGSYGERIGVTIGAVSATTAGSTVAFSGGTGDILPAQTSAIELRAEDTINVGAGTTNNGLDTVMQFSAGAGILLANNSRSFKAKNSSGTPRDILYASSSNFLLVGDGGWPTISLQGYTETWGVKTIEVNGAGRVAGADTDITGNGSSTPGVGTILAVRNSTDGTTRLSCKFTTAGWRAVALT